MAESIDVVLLVELLGNRKKYGIKSEIGKWTKLQYSKKALEEAIEGAPRMTVVISETTQG